ncbi:putative phytosulfokines 3-like [Capsicum annuum]|nr:putative phytosulfokines 3-like [Capsicum annuum]
MKIPPPPCYYERPPRLIRSSSRRGFKKQDDDPFYIAYKECTKTSRKGKVVDDFRNDDCFVGMKMNKNYMSSLFSCKHSCGVRDDSVVMINLSHIPISRSIREKRGGACTTREDDGPYLIYRRDGGDGHNLKSKLFGSAFDGWSQNGNGELLKSHMGEIRPRYRRTRGGSQLINQNHYVKNSSPYAIFRVSRQEVHFWCPNELMKWSVGIHPPINKASAKQAIVLTLTLKGLPQLRKYDNSPYLSFSYPLDDAMSIIMWNTRSSYNDVLKRIGEFIQSYNSYMVALLETSLEDHAMIKDGFRFSNYLEVLVLGGFGGIMILCRENIFAVTRLRNSSQELHMMVKVHPDSTN